MNAPARKIAPYVFYGQTTSMCGTCMALVPAKIIIEDGSVFYLKRCKAHGVEKALVSTDVAYYKLCHDYLKPGDRPLNVQTRTELGCPYDCGLCPDHEQHSCLALIDVNEACNLTCPVCFADSSTKRPRTGPLAEIERMMDALVASEGEPDLLQLSGGEPTIHPQIIEIIEAAKRRPIRHIMLNTNGIRIAEEPDFVKQLAGFKPGFEVYLQFDSLRAPVHKNLRGADLTRIRRQALEALERENISTTLVVVVKAGQNDDELGEIIDFALQWKLRARHHLPADPGCGPKRGLRPGEGPHRALRHPRADHRGGNALRRRRHHSAAVQPGIDRHRLCAEEGRATSRPSRPSSQKTCWWRRCPMPSPSRNIRTFTPGTEFLLAVDGGVQQSGKAQRASVLPAGCAGAGGLRL